MNDDDNRSYKLTDVKLKVMVDGAAIPNGIECTVRSLDSLEAEAQKAIALAQKENRRDWLELTVIAQLPDTSHLYYSYLINHHDPQADFSRGEFIELLAQKMGQAGVLAPLDVSRYSEVHVSYAHRFHYLEIYRDDKYGSRKFYSHSFSGPIHISVVSRFRLIELLSYNWTFSFEDSDWAHHYYSGSLTKIHKSLLNHAMKRGYSHLSNIDQTAAFEGLLHLYRLCPDLMKSLDFYDLSFFVTASIPGAYNHLAVLAQSVLKELYSQHSKTILSLETLYAIQVQEWLDAVNERQVLAQKASVEPEKIQPAPVTFIPTKSLPIVTSKTSEAEKLQIALASKAVKPIINPFSKL